jgi:heptosyltransferase-2/heptosyltransferase-3
MIVDPQPHPIVVRFGAMGDMVLLTVLIRALSERFQLPIDIVASGPWTRPLLEGQPGVGRLFVIRSRRRPYWLSAEQRRLVDRLRERGPGPVWVCESDDAKPVWLLERAGFAAGMIARSTDYPRAPGEHFADRWLRFAASTPPDLQGSPAGTPIGTLPQSLLVVSPRSRADLDSWLRARGPGGRPLILIQAGNKRTMRLGLRRRATNTKYWPEEHWARVLRGLRAQCPEHALLLLGVPREWRLNEDIRRRAALDGVFNVADDLPIPRLLALAERATGLVAVDSGPAHAAVAVGCPTVVLFGRAEAALYAPRGPDTVVQALTGMVDGERSMLGITAEDVLAAWREMMTRASGRGLERR